MATLVTMLAKKRGESVGDTLEKIRAGELSRIVTRSSEYTDDGDTDVSYQDVTIDVSCKLIRTVCSRRQEYYSGEMSITVPADIIERGESAVERYVLDQIEDRKTDLEYDDCGDEYDHDTEEEDWDERVFDVEEIIDLGTVEED